MKTVRSTFFFPCLAVAACLAAGGSLQAQDSAQKGQSVGRLEMSQQIRAANSESLDVKAAEALRRARKPPVMSPLESSEAFRMLDLDQDMQLTRSELPGSMAILRAQFDRYDRDHDHRLSYSEFANYTDTVSGKLADSAH